MLFLCVTWTWKWSWMSMIWVNDNKGWKHCFFSLNKMIMTLWPAILKILWNWIKKQKKNKTTKKKLSSCTFENWSKKIQIWKCRPTCDSFPWSCHNIVNQLTVSLDHLFGRLGRNLSTHATLRISSKLGSLGTYSKKGGRYSSTLPVKKKKEAISPLFSDVTYVFISITTNMMIHVKFATTTVTESD